MSLMQNVIVTGAGKGLGKAIAKQLLDDGLRVIAVDRDGELLSSLGAQFGDGIELRVEIFPVHTRQRRSANGVHM